MKQERCQKGRAATPQEAEIMTLQNGKEDSQRHQERKKMTPTAGSEDSQRHESKEEGATTKGKEKTHQRGRSGRVPSASPDKEQEQKIHQRGRTVRGTSASPEEEEASAKDSKSAKGKAEMRMTAGGLAKSASACPATGVESAFNWRKLMKTTAEVVSKGENVLKGGAREGSEEDSGASSDSDTSEASSKDKALEDKNAVAHVADKLRVLTINVTMLTAVRLKLKLKLDASENWLVQRALWACGPASLPCLLTELLAV